MIKLSAFSDEAGSALEVQIEALRRNNIHLTELRSVGGKNVKDLSSAECYAIAEKLDEAGIGVSAIGSPIGKVDISEDFEEYIQVFVSMCNTAKIFSTDKMRVFSFFNAYDNRELVIERMKRLVDIGAKYGIGLYHENEKKIYGDTVERILDLHDNVPGLRFVYDPANFLQVGEAADKTLPAIYPISDYFHIKDVVVETDQLVPAGQGDGRIPELISMIDHDTVLTLEPHLKVFKGYSEIDGEKMNHRFEYKSGDEAFDAAATALKKLLNDAGYRENTKGEFTK